MTLRIGLTGGIGSGKSTVAELFEQLGVKIIDADSIAREITDSNPTLRAQLVAHFGKNILNDLGHLNRAALRKIIFSDPQQRRWLEKILHPLIITEIKQRTAQITDPYCIIVIPLLTDLTDPHTLIDRVLVVDTPVEIQIQRTQARDHLTPEFIKKILNSQASREQRLRIADDVIANQHSLEIVGNEVQRLHKFYTSTADRP